jgi:hypothetical protein
MNDVAVNFDTFSDIDDARRWRNRAEEMRMIADEMIKLASPTRP